jgi:hypothetical protein
LILLRNALTTGFADIVMVYGIPNDVPVAGVWPNSVVSGPPSSGHIPVLITPTAGPVQITPGTGLGN